MSRRPSPLLDEAGWVLDGDVRKKGDLELSVSYYTSINSVRQKTQAVNKKNWEDAGIKVQLGQVTADVFFSSAPGNDQTFYHNYRDIDMFTDNPTSTIPLGYMLSFYAGADNSNVSQKSNQWTGGNNARYVNPDYDALYDQAVASTDAEEVAELCIQMNDLLINDFVLIPVVARAGVKDAASLTLQQDNLAPNGWETSYWNIANWSAAAE